MASIIKKLSRQVAEISNEFRYLAGGHYAWFVTAPNAEWRQNHLPIFTGHGFDAVAFEPKLRFLAENSYSTPAFRDAYDYLLNGAALPGRPVLLTFDDGYESVWTQGAPLLKKYGFKAIAFIVPAWIGRKNYLNWKQVEQMVSSGLFDVQSHTMNHIPEVCGQGLDLPQVERELTESKAAIESRLPGHRVEHLCYPQGLGSEPAVQASKKAGYRTNFWCGRLDRNENRRGDDPYYIVRVKHDYIVRLPGKGRQSLAAIYGGKVKRRLTSNAYA